MVSLLEAIHWAHTSVQLILASSTSTTTTILCVHHSPEMWLRIVICSLLIRTNSPRIPKSSKKLERKDSLMTPFPSRTGNRSELFTGKASGSHCFFLFEMMLIDQSELVVIVQRDFVVCCYLCVLSTIQKFFSFRNTIKI